MYTDDQLREQLRALRDKTGPDFHCKTDIGDRALCVEPDAMNVAPRVPMFKLLLQSPRWAGRVCSRCKKLYEAL